jgi:hypothetical protein
MEYRLKRLLTAPLVILAALLLWFWEWMWEPLERFMERIGHLPILGRIESWIAKAPRYLALACFLIPGLALFPFKVAGLYFLGHGSPFLGLLSILLAKVVGTALVARIFTLTRHQLMEIAWFARAYEATVRFRNLIFDRLHQHPAYILLHNTLDKLRNRSRRIRRGIIYHLRSRWMAIRRTTKHRNQN